MARFTIKISNFEQATVTDTVTNKAYICPLELYQRTHNNGKRYYQIYVNVADVETKKMKDKFSFPDWKADVTKTVDEWTNPVGLETTSDLDGRTKSTTLSKLFGKMA